jgi:hypothetical protein
MIGARTNLRFIARDDFARAKHLDRRPASLRPPAISSV